MVDPTEVWTILGRSDLFVLCSDTEGMPRALIEAMAAGLPCVGSAVGGVPELLGPEALFEPGSLAGLRRVLQRFVDDRELRRKASRQNVERAAAFAPDVLDEAQARFRSAELAAASRESSSTYIGSASGRERGCPSV